MKKVLLFTLSFLVLFICFINISAFQKVTAHPQLMVCSPMDPCDGGDTGDDGGGYTSDTVYPVILVSEENFTLHINQEEPDWLSYFTAFDNIDGEIVITSEDIDEDVDTSIIGDYTVTVTVRDSSNNIKGESIQVRVLPYIVNTGLEASLYQSGDEFDIEGGSADGIYEVWIFPYKVLDEHPDMDAPVFFPKEDTSIIVLVDRSGDSFKYYSCDNNCTFRNTLPFFTYTLDSTIDLEDIKLTYWDDFMIQNDTEYEFYEDNTNGYNYENGHFYYKEQIDFNADIYSWNTQDMHSDYEKSPMMFFAYENTDGTKLLMTTLHNPVDNVFGGYNFVNLKGVCQTNSSLCTDLNGEDENGYTIPPTKSFYVSGGVINSEEYFRYISNTEEPPKIFTWDQSLPDNIILVSMNPVPE